MIAIATDIHVDKDNIPEVQKSLEFLLDYCNNNRIKTLFLLGDLFTDRTGQTQSTLLFWKRILKKLTNEGDIDVYMIPGNHDKTNLESEDSYLDLFEGMNRVHLYQSGGVVYRHKSLFALMPYFKENGTYVERLIALNKEVASLTKKHNPDRVYLGTHIAVDQVRNNDGSTVVNNIKPELFKMYDKVFVGHYHNEQQIDNIWYIGSLQPKDFGEDNEKGFIIIDGEHNYERIKPDFKKYIKINIDLDDVSDKSISKLREKYSSSIHNVRFVFKGTVEQLDKIDKKKFSESGIDVKKNSKALLKSIKSASCGEIVSFNKVSIVKSFLEFCKINRVPATKMNKGLKYIKNN